MAGDLDDLLSDFDLQDCLNSNFLKSLPDYDPKAYISPSTCPGVAEKRFVVTPIYDFSSFRFYPESKRNSIIIGVFKSWSQISGDRKFDTSESCLSAARRYQEEVRKANFSRFNAFPVIALFCHDKDEKVPDIYQGNVDIISTFQPSTFHQMFGSYYLIRNVSRPSITTDLGIKNFPGANFVSVTTEHIDPETSGLIDSFTLDNCEIQIWSTAEIGIEGLKRCVTDRALIDICYDVIKISLPACFPEIQGVGHLVCHFTTIRIPGIHLGYHLINLGHHVNNCHYTRLLNEVEDLKAEIAQLRAIPPRDDPVLPEANSGGTGSSPFDDDSESESDGEPSSAATPPEIFPDPDPFTSNPDLETSVDEIESKTTEENSDSESPKKTESPEKKIKPILKPRARVSFSVPTKKRR